MQCEFDEDLRMTVHWNYIGDCTSKNLSWTEDILWRSDPESYIEGEKYFGYDEGNSGPSVTDFIPYTEYQFLVQLSAIEFSEQHNCTSPQEGEAKKGVKKGLKGVKVKKGLKGVKGAIYFKCSYLYITTAIISKGIVANRVVMIVCHLK